MPVSRSERDKPGLQWVDWALIVSYLIGAVLGTATSCLMVHDGAVLLTAAWLGNAWDIYFSQNASRAVSTLMMFGPIWGLRRAFDLSSGAFIALGHCLYFAGPLLLWAVLRVLEPNRLFSRLFLAMALALVYFLTELVIGAAFWMMWMAVVANPERTDRIVAIATVVLGAGMALSHPTTGLMSLVFLIALGGLALLGRPLPRRIAIATAALTVLLIAAYFAESTWLPATNPTILIAVDRIRYDYVDPRWMLATLVLFPMLAALWLLMLAPGVNALNGRWRFSRPAISVIAIFGVWFAAAGTGLVGGVHHCFIDFDRATPLVKHLQSNVPPELKAQVVFREIKPSEIGTLLSSPPGTGSIQLSARHDPGKRSVVQVYVWHPDGESNALAPYEQWLWKESRRAFAAEAARRDPAAALPPEPTFDADSTWLVLESHKHFQDRVEAGRGARVDGRSVPNRSGSSSYGSRLTSR